MAGPIGAALDRVLDRYDVPAWARAYIYRYAMHNPANAVSFAISLVDVKRKKGGVSKDKVILPNGTEMDVHAISRLLNLFLYGEERISLMESSWAKHSAANRNPEYEACFMKLSEIEARRAKAIKNLIEGLKQKIEPDHGPLMHVFDYMESMDDWKDRVIATGIILRYSYAATFGDIFYRAFYAVAPEYMRSFGKAFKETERWDTAEAARIISSKELDESHVMDLARGILSDVLNSVHANMGIAKELRLEKEIQLMSDISIAHPFQKLKELGLHLNVDEELERVKALAASKQKIEGA